MKEAFAKFDVDGGGTVDRQELITVVKLLGKAISENELMTMMDQIDNDRSGELVRISYFDCLLLDLRCGDALQISLLSCHSMVSSGLGRVHRHHA